MFTSDKYMCRANAEVGISQESRGCVCVLFKRSLCVAELNAVTRNSHQPHPNAMEVYLIFISVKRSDARIQYDLYLCLISRTQCLYDRSASDPIRRGEVGRLGTCAVTCAHAVRVNGFYDGRSAIYSPPTSPPKQPPERNRTLN